MRNNLTKIEITKDNIKISLTIDDREGSENTDRERKHLRKADARVIVSVKEEGEIEQTLIHYLCRQEVDEKHFSLPPLNQCLSLSPSR